jgi:hypothetical protein
MSTIYLYSFSIGIFPKLTKDITPLHTTDGHTDWETEVQTYRVIEVKPSKSIENCNLLYFSDT